MRELFDVKPEFISLVEAGANRRTFKIFKSANSKESKVNKKGRYAELAEKFFKESFIEKVKEYMKDWFANMQKTQEEIDSEEKGGETMNKEKETEEQKKVREKEEARIKKEAKEKEEKEKIEKEAMKVKVAEAVESILQDKAQREELKGLIEKVEKGEEKPEDIIKLREALGMKAEEKPEELAKKVEKLQDRIKELEKGKKKSVTGQDGEPEGIKWPSFKG